VSVLSLEEVSKRYRLRRREHVALRGVCLSVERGELVAVLGTRKSGRSTLLRIAAGLERPDEGAVLFRGTPLSATRDVVGRQISYCHAAFSPMEGERVVDHVAAALLARRVSSTRARRDAEGVLERASVVHCAPMHPCELDGVESVRVAIARGLVASPSMLVIDDPTSRVGLHQSAGVVRLLRSIADEGVAVLMSTDDATSISGADRVLHLNRGVLDGEAQSSQAEVVPLHPRDPRIESDAHTM
jgi:ABC-type ATPase involved in cell division